MKRAALFLLLGACGLGADPGAQTPPQALKQFQLEKGLHIEVAAAEPEVVDPVALCFDERGRMYVVENRGYPHVGPAAPPTAGVIALLEDTNADGRYDKRTVFADGFTFPNGVACWRGGVFVTCAPDIFYLKDTDGDGRADVRRVVLTGFGVKSSSEQLRVAHPTLGADGWMYVTSGLTSAEVSSPQHPGRAAVKMAKNDGRFHPDTLEFQPLTGEGQFGLAFDPWGNRFVCSNRNPLQHVILLPGQLQRHPHFTFADSVHDAAAPGVASRVWPLSPDTTAASFHPTLINSQHTGTFTAACGIVIFDGDSLTPAHVGNAFICEPAQNLVQRQVLSRAGGTFAAKVAEPGREFLASPDQWFRPVFAANGPDGALYICDMYRKYIDHPVYLPEAVRGRLDFNAGKAQGRIWRVLAENRKEAARPTSLAGASPEQLFAAQESPRGWVRNTAQRLLREAGERVPAMVGKTAEARVLRLQLGQLNEARLLAALGDAHPRVREGGLKLSAAIPAPPDTVLKAIRALAEDADPHVRFQCALRWNGAAVPEDLHAMAAILAGAPDDVWTRAAVLSGTGEPLKLLEALVASGKNPLPDMAEALQPLGRMVALKEPEEAVRKVLATHLDAGARWRGREQMALLAGLAAGAQSRVTKEANSTTIARWSSGEASAQRNVQRVFALAGAAVSDAAGSPASRIAAVELLALAPPDEARPALLAMLRPNEPTALQVAAVKAIAATVDVAGARALLDRQRWQAYLPEVREAVLAAMLSRAAFLPALVDALESGVVAPVALTPARRGSLLQNKDPKVGPRAKVLFDKIDSGDRQQVFQSHKDVLLMKADGARGAAVFQKACITCHTHAGKGHAVGPDLTGLRNQPAETLLLHILVPNHEVVVGYTLYEMETRDGESVSGILVAQTPESLTLRMPLGLSKTVARGDLKTLRASALSLMPNELEKTMTRQELADLLAFLKQ